MLKSVVVKHPYEIDNTKIITICVRRGGCSLTHSARNPPARANPKTYEEVKKKKKEEARIMPSLVATTSALTRTTFAPIHNCLHMKTSPFMFLLYQGINTCVKIFYGILCALECFQS